MVLATSPQDPAGDFIKKPPGAKKASFQPSCSFFRTCFFLLFDLNLDQVSAVYDQVSQLVPVQQVDDIDEAHQLDPVHQVDHKDELWGDPGANFCCFFEPWLVHLFATIFLNIHLYDLLDVLDLVDELHLCHPLVVLEPAD